jgi:UTP---glucose-1-phosphate uridylyltransferase
MKTAKHRTADAPTQSSPSRCLGPAAGTRESGQGTVSSESICASARRLSRPHRAPLIPSRPRSHLSPPPLPRSMASRAQPPPCPPPHLRLRLHASPLFSSRLPQPRCRGGWSRLLSALPSPFPPSRSQRVSTARLEREPGPATSSSEQQQPRRDPALAAEIARLSAVRARLGGACTLHDKLRVLHAEPRVAAFFGEESSRGVLSALEAREVLLLKCLVAAGQEHVLGDELDWSGAWQHDRHEKNGVNGGSALREALYTLAGLVGKWSSEGVVGGETNSGEMEPLPCLLKFLGEIEEFYDCIGGIIG